MKQKATMYFSKISIGVYFFCEASWAGNLCDLRFLRDVLTNTPIEALRAAEKAAEKNARVYSSDTNRVAKSIRASKEIFRKRLGLFHDHAFPYIEVDETPAAKVWAHHILGSTANLDKSVSDKLDPVKITQSLVRDVETFKNYHLQIKEYETEVVNIAIEKFALEKFVKTGVLSRGPFSVSIETIGPDQKLITQHRPFENLERLKLRLKELKFKSDEIYTLAKKRAFEQARIENRFQLFFGEYALLKSKILVLPNMEDETASLLLALDNHAHEALTSRLRPPLWAVEKIKWLHLWKEVKAVVVNDLPIQETEALLKAFGIEFEKKAKGGGKFSRVLEKFSEFLKRTRWGVVSGTALAATPLVYKLGGVFFSFVVEDEKIKEKCIAASTQEEFIECVTEYLKKRFAGKFELDKSKVRGLLTGKEKATDDELNEEIKDLQDKRKVFIQENNLPAESDK